MSADIDELLDALSESRGESTGLRKLNNQLELEKNTRYDTQEKRTAAVRKIGNIENKNIYEDTLQAVSNKSSRHVEKLCNISLSTEIEKKNKVVREFIDAVTAKGTEKGVGVSTSTERITSKTDFQRFQAIENIYGARNLNYVSDLTFAVQAVNHSVTKSELSANIFGHCTTAASANLLNIWLKSMENNCPPAPNGLIEYAFDNEQRLMRTWLSRRGNKQTLDILTNIIVCQLHPTSILQ
ncbi:uncharacterized protein LOC144450194 [Glandiceps talaboti]